jgi:hypothetical protein
MPTTIQSQDVDQRARDRHRTAERSGGVLVLLTLIALYIVGLCTLVTFSEDEFFFRTFMENGLFEQGALTLWILLGIAVLIRPIENSIRPYVIAALFFLCAAREADLHKAFTAEGILRLSYYIRSDAPLSEKLLGLPVAAIFLTLVFYAVASALIYLWRGRQEKGVCWYCLGAGLAGLLISRVVERVPILLTKVFSIEIHPVIGRYSLGLEEGLELLLPVLLFAALLSSHLSMNSRQIYTATIDLPVRSKDHA